MKLIEIYQQHVTDGKVTADAQQLQILAKLQLIFDQLQTQQKHERQWWYRLLKGIGLIKKSQLNGLYLWGNVGRGKTFLMDIFFNALPLQRKLRLHFHVFMQQVHHDLQRLQGHVNPLQLVARHFALKAKVLCFDEFFVDNITDAMLLGHLFTALFARGVMLITTSNQPPDALYANGLQRHLFLPTIALLKQHCTIMALDNGIDYRLRNLTQAGVYFYPLNAEAHQRLLNSFNLYAHHAEELAMPIIIESRPIATVMLANKIVWFEFNVICNTPRSQLDYLAIARQFKIVIISNVPQIKAHENDKISYLINLVDVFYDQHIQLILSAEVPATELYCAGDQLAQFQRTASRLIEMQSTEYLQGA